MSMNGKLSPFGVTVLSNLLNGGGIGISQTTNEYVGTSTVPEVLATYGSIVQTVTSLYYFTLSKALAYDINNLDNSIGTGVTNTTLSNLLNIGRFSIPALVNTPSASYPAPTIDILNKNGFIFLIANQARLEYNFNDVLDPIPNLALSFVLCYNYMKQQNKVINSLTNSNTFLQGVYSNNNDLITGDITGVSLSTVYWGTDLIKTGRAIDLAAIDDFGNPVNLLFTLQANNAITKAVGLALLTAGLTTSEIGQILSKLVQPTPVHKKRIYDAFLLIREQDLKDVLIALNCQTEGLISLADLLNIRKLFPTSYRTLTMPVYNATNVPTNSKTYYLIYNDQGVNNQLEMYGEKFFGILPNELAIGCSAFSIAMMQIKNITNMNIEKFAQVVANLENVSNLTLQTGSQPINPTAVNTALSSIAMGTGINGTYTMCDFFGSISFASYESDFKQLKEILSQIDFSSLNDLALAIYNLLSGAGPYDIQLQSYIDSTNGLLDSILSNDSKIINDLNIVWDRICSRLNKEQSTRLLPFPVDLTDIEGTSGDIINFVNSMAEYALDTQPCGAAQVLEGMSQDDFVIAYLREIRNSTRISLMGGEMDNLISDLPNNQLCPINSNNKTNDNIPGIEKATGKAIEPGSLAGSSQVGLVPCNLDIFNIAGTIQSSIIEPEQAVEEVIHCNCDCWTL